MYDYIKEKGIPYVQTGKLIVAVDEEELPRLRALCVQLGGCTVDNALH